MEDISENRKLKWLLALMFFTATCLIFDVSPELRESLQMTPFPDKEF
jgi:hypothetical protein